jgi:hypothetical protein
MFCNPKASYEGTNLSLAFPHLPKVVQGMSKYPRLKNATSKDHLPLPLIASPCPSSLRSERKNFSLLRYRVLSLCFNACFFDFRFLSFQARLCPMMKAHMLFFSLECIHFLPHLGELWDFGLHGLILHVLFRLVFSFRLDLVKTTSVATSSILLFVFQVTWSPTLIPISAPRCPSKHSHTP